MVVQPTVPCSPDLWINHVGRGYGKLGLGPKIHARRDFEPKPLRATPIAPNPFQDHPRSSLIFFEKDLHSCWAVGLVAFADWFLLMHIPRTYPTICLFPVSVWICKRPPPSTPADPNVVFPRGGPLAWSQRRGTDGLQIPIGASFGNWAWGKCKPLGDRWFCASFHLGKPFSAQYVLTHSQLPKGPRFGA